MRAIKSFGASHGATAATGHGATAATGDTGHVCTPLRGTSEGCGAGEALARSLRAISARGFPGFALRVPTVFFKLIHAIATGLARCIANELPCSFIQGLIQSIQRPAPV